MTDADQVATAVEEMVGVGAVAEVIRDLFLFFNG